MSEGQQSGVNLRPVWDALLAVYKPFAEICERHNLRMWVAYGTLLGAVRHKGFIPWDDDFDVMMPRCDWDRFLAIAKKELPSHLQLITQRNTPEFSLPFAKVQETRGDLIRAVEEKFGGELKQGIYIDVFPLDGMDGWKTPLANSFVCMIMKFRRAYLYRRLYPKSRKNLILFSLGFICGFIVPWIWSRKAFVRSYEKMMRMKSFDSCKHCTYYDPTYTRQHPFQVKAYDKTVMLDFDAIKVPCPEGWDSWLRSEYGNYMTLPPERKRTSTHQNTLAQWKFGRATSKKGSRVDECNI